MLACLIVQRTNTLRFRAAALFIVLVSLVITALCGAFLLLRIPIPEWSILVGRWVPALLTLIVLSALRLPGGIGWWWGLRPGGWRRLLTGVLTGVLVLLAVYVATAAMAGALGLATLRPMAELVAIAAVLPVYILVFAVSTFGEEVAWRGFLQRALAPWGFWRASTVVALVWAVFHVPLHGAMALQGSLPWTAALSSTALLVPLGLLLSACAVRFGSVWPAVFAHALPLSALNLLVDPGQLDVTAQLAITGISAALLLGAAALLAPRSARSHHPEPVQVTVNGSAAP